jgi:hypothetical protein
VGVALPQAANAAIPVSPALNFRKSRRAKFLFILHFSLRNMTTMPRFCAMNDRGELRGKWQDSDRELDTKFLI